MEAEAEAERERQRRRQQEQATAEPPTLVSIEWREALDPTALEADIPRATRSISCPSFSGPGYVKERHPSRPITVPVLEAPYKEPPTPRHNRGASTSPRLEPVALSDVRLLAGSLCVLQLAASLILLAGHLVEHLPPTLERKDGTTVETAAAVNKAKAALRSTLSSALAVTTVCTFDLLVVCVCNSVIMNEYVLGGQYF